MQQRTKSDTIAFQRTETFHQRGIYANVHSEDDYRLRLDYDSSARLDDIGVCAERRMANTTTTSDERCNETEFAFTVE